MCIESITIIHYILDADSRVDDYVNIAEYFITFYTNLFTSVRPVFLLNFQELLVLTIPGVVNLSLNVVSSITEVHKDVFSMENRKRLGPDGMSPIFFKQF